LFRTAAVAALFVAPLASACTAIGAGAPAASTTD
jgi:hypothetical protein